MRNTLLPLVLALGLMTSSHAEEKLPEMSPYTTAYSGGEGYRVWIARIGPKANQEALVQISGIDHKLDGRVLRAKLMPSANGANVKYTATIDGQSYELVTVEGTRATLRITGAPWSSELTYDKTLVNDRAPQHLLTDYLESAQAKR